MRAGVGEELDHLDLGRIVDLERRFDFGEVDAGRELRLCRQGECQQADKSEGVGGETSDKRFLHGCSLILLHNVGFDALAGEFGAHAVDFVLFLERTEADAVPDLVLKHHLLHRCFCSH